MTNRWLGILLQGLNARLKPPSDFTAKVMMRIRQLRCVVLLGLMTQAAVGFSQNPNTAAFPGALDSDAELLVANDAAQTTLDGALTATAMTINVVSAASLTAFPTSCWVGSEIIKIASKSTNALTVATDCASGTCATCSPTTDCRGWGFASTTEAAHVSAATFTCGPTAEYGNAAAAAIIAIETALGVNLEDIGHIKCDSPTELTVSAGAITILKSACYTVDTEADAASDDLDVINCTAGQRFILTPADTTRTVVIKDDDTNIDIQADFSLNHLHDLFGGRCFSANVVIEEARSNAGT